MSSGDIPEDQKDHDVPLEGVPFLSACLEQERRREWESELP